MKTKEQAAWRWGRSGVVVDRVVDGMEERVWLNARLPSEADRARFARCVELLFWDWSPRVMRTGLDVVWDYFHADSLLVAMIRRHEFTRLLIYTAANEALMDERCAGVRAVLKPTMSGRRITVEPAWESFVALGLPRDVEQRAPTNGAAV